MASTKNNSAEINHITRVVPTASTTTAVVSAAADVDKPNGLRVIPNV